MQRKLFKQALAVFFILLNIIYIYYYIDQINNYNDRLLKFHISTQQSTLVTPLEINIEQSLLNRNQNNMYAKDPEETTGLMIKDIESIIEALGKKAEK